MLPLTGRSSWLFSSSQPPIVGSGANFGGAIALSRALETGLFVATQRDVFHVWNVERTAEPLLSKQATRASLSSAAWSGEKDVFALGDSAGRVRVRSWCRRNIKAHH